MLNLLYVCRYYLNIRKFVLERCKFVLWNVHVKEYRIIQQTDNAGRRMLLFKNYLPRMLLSHVSILCRVLPYICGPGTFNL